jgi:hypothetical protein
MVEREPVDLSLLIPLWKAHCIREIEPLMGQGKDKALSRRA